MVEYKQTSFFYTLYTINKQICSTGKNQAVWLMSIYTVLNAALPRQLHLQIPYRVTTFEGSHRFA